MNFSIYLFVLQIFAKSYVIRHNTGGIMALYGNKVYITKTEPSDRNRISLSPDRKTMKIAGKNVCNQQGKISVCSAPSAITMDKESNLKFRIRFGRRCMGIGKSEIINNKEVNRVITKKCRIIKKKNRVWKLEPYIEPKGESESEVSSKTEESSDNSTIESQPSKKVNIGFLNVMLDPDRGVYNALASSNNSGDNSEDVLERLFKNGKFVNAANFGTAQVPDVRYQTTSLEEMAIGKDPMRDSRFNGQRTNLLA